MCAALNETHATETRNAILPYGAIDVASAATTTLAVSPLMVVIDRVIIERASAGVPITRSVKLSLTHMLRHPLRYTKDPGFRSMSLLYGGTFFTANAIDSATSIVEDLPAGHTTDSFAESGTVTAVNMVLPLYKDTHFARIYGRPLAGSLPLVSYLPFMLRDCITIYACFTLPLKMAPSLPEALGTDNRRLMIAQLMIRS